MRADRLAVASPQRLDERVGAATRRGRQLLDRERPPHEHLGSRTRLVDAEGRDRAASLHRPDTFEQLQQPEPRQLVARVVGEPEQADEVFYVRSLEKSQAAVLHVGNAPARELELEVVAVMRGANEHGLLPQGDALLAVRQNLLAHGLDLRVFVATADEARSFGARRRLGAQPRHESFGRGGADRIGDIEDRLDGAVVVLEQDRRHRRERRVDVEEMPRARAAEAVHGLRVVSHDREPGIGGAQRAAARRPGVR